MSIGRDVTETFQLGDQKHVEIRASIYWSDDNDSPTGTVVLPGEKYYTGNPLQMLRELGDQITALSNALVVTSDDEVPT